MSKSRSLGVYLKILVLILSLFFVLWGSSYFASPDFQKSVDAIFGIDQPHFSWCSVGQNKFVWKNSNLEEKFKDSTVPYLLNHTCSIYLEPLNMTHDEVKKLTWEPLAEASDADGKPTLLEWNKEHKVYKTNRLPFKSTKLYNFFGLE